MTPEDRLKIYMSFTDTTRKWVTAMDAKAAFLSALNGVLIAFLWSGMRLSEGPQPSWALAAAAVSTVLALAGVGIALCCLLPRERPKVVFGGTAEWSSEYKPFSFYGFIASTYGPKDFSKLEADLAQRDESAFAQEALEQHFTISHVVQTKSLCVTRAGYVSLAAILLGGVALLLKIGGI